MSDYKPTYDDRRLEAVPCRGGCGKLLAGDWGPTWTCVRCAHGHSRSTAAPSARLEKHEQADCVRVLKSLGAAVYVLGTVRPRADSHHGTCQTPGISDVEAWLPVKGQPGARKLLKFEVKRARGSRLSPEQAAYRQHCEDAGVAYVCGDLSALMRWLVEHGYLRRDQVPAERLKDSAWSR